MAFPMPVPPPVTMATWCCSKSAAKQLLPLTQEFMTVTRLSEEEQGKLNHRGHAHVTSRAPPRPRSLARVAPPSLRCPASPRCPAPLRHPAPPRSPTWHAGRCGFQSLQGRSVPQRLHPGAQRSPPAWVPSTCR